MKLHNPFSNKVPRVILRNFPAEERELWEMARQTVEDFQEYPKELTDGGAQTFLVGEVRHQIVIQRRKTGWTLWYCGSEPNDELDDATKQYQED